MIQLATARGSVATNNANQEIPGNTRSVGLRAIKVMKTERFNAVPAQPRSRMLSLTFAALLLAVCLAVLSVSLAADATRNFVTHASAAPPPTAPAGVTYVVNMTGDAPGIGPTNRCDTVVDIPGIQTGDQVAEEVEQVEPRLTFKNQNSEIEGVNYSQLTAVLINAVKEQQAQIKNQQQQIDLLKKLVCRSHRRAAVCK